MKPRRFAEEFLALVRKYGLEQYCPELYYAIRDAERDAMSESRARYYLYRAEEFVAGLRHRPVHLFETPETQEDLYKSIHPDVAIGGILQAPEIRYGFNFWPIPHSTLLIGAPGTGKSTLVRGSLKQLTGPGRRHNRPVSVIVFEGGKPGGSADMPSLCGGEWVVVRLAGSRCLGWNGPITVLLNTWITRASKAFAAAFGLQAGADVLARLITWCVLYLNPTGAAPLLYPDFAMLIRVLRAIPHVFSEKQIYTQALIQKLCEAERAGADAFGAFGGLDITALIAEGKSVVIDFTGIDSPELRTFVIALITSAILLDRQARSHFVDGLEVLVVCDDADRCVSAELAKRFGAHGSPLEEFAEVGREMGLAVMICVHSLVGIAQGIAANCSNVIVFGLTDAGSMSMAAQYLMLSRDQARLLTALRVGECLFRQADSLWPLPLIGCVDYVPPNRSTQPPVYTVPECIPAKPLDELPDLVKAIEAHRRPAKKPAASKAPTVKKLNDWARNILSLADIYRWMPYHHLCKRLDKPISMSSRMAARDVLQESGLLEFADARIESSLVTLLRLTPEGSEYLHRAATDLDLNRTIEHAHYQHWIYMDAIRKGLDARLEFVLPDNPHRADVGVRQGRFWDCYEVVQDCHGNLTDHITACLLQSKVVGRVVVVAARKSKLRELRTLIEAEPLLDPVRSKIAYETPLTVKEALFPS